MSKKKKHAKHIFFTQLPLLILLGAASVVLHGFLTSNQTELTSIEVASSTVATTSDYVVVSQKETEKVPRKELFTYVEVTDGCGAHFDGVCLNVRSGPGVSYPIVYQLRSGVVLRTDGVLVEGEGRTWYKIIFDEWLRYPERVESDWYVAADFVRLLENPGVVEFKKGDSVPSQKKIIIDISEQTLYAYEGKDLFMQELVSTGLELTRTPRGSFTLFKKMPSRYMQGPLPDISDQYYDLPGVPWTMYFTGQGAAIHGAYWHEKFGERWSHGCVNLPPMQAKELYEWADVGTPVIVRD